MSLASCKLPKEWKLHCIIPIFKSGDKSLISNYRPISLLCSISKVLERIVYDKVFGFIGQSISKSQYGFLRDHSCLQQLFSFLSCVEKSLERRCQHDTIYLDFQKAFDRVPHKELLFKLHDLGISGRWFKEYLTSRWKMVPSMVTTQLSYRYLLEFRKEASLGLCFSWFISMIFLLALTSLIFISLQMIPNALIR